MSHTLVHIYHRIGVRVTTPLANDLTISALSLFGATEAQPGVFEHDDATHCCQSLPCQLDTKCGIIKKIFVNPDFQIDFLMRECIKSYGLFPKKIFATKGNTSVVRQDTETSRRFENRFLWGPDLYLPNAKTVNLKHLKGSICVERIHVKPGTTVIPWRLATIEIIYDQKDAAGDQIGDSEERAQPPPYADEPPSYDEATQRGGKPATRSAFA